MDRILNPLNTAARTFQHSVQRLAVTSGGSWSVFYGKSGSAKFLTAVLLFLCLAFAQADNIRVVAWNLKQTAFQFLLQKEDATGITASG